MKARCYTYLHRFLKVQWYKRFRLGLAYPIKLGTYIYHSLVGDKEDFCSASWVSQTIILLSRVFQTITILR